VVVTTYMLATTATTQVWGKLGDQYGRKYLFIASIVIFLIGSALSGLSVQNSADFADLGAATSGATFFRTIGGSYGVSIFGAIFSNRLAVELTSALRGVHLPAGFSIASTRADPSALKKLPGAIRADVLHAYSGALHPVFAFAIPVAGIAFVLSWFLREVPLRVTSSAGIGGPGRGAPRAFLRR
jgi:MFS family permease